MSMTNLSPAQIDVVRFAGWLDVDDNWLRHVLAYEYSCGCKLYHGSDEEDIEECRIWKASQAEIAAREELARAKAELEKARNSMEVSS